MPENGRATDDRRAGADEQFERLVSDRFHAQMARHPVWATYLGITDHDGRLADGSREAMLHDIADAHAHLAALEMIDPSALSAANAVERELALFAIRRELFDAETHRVWDRRASATDEIGDGVFLLLARGSRPLAERLADIASRLEAAPAAMAEHLTRLGERPPVRLWNEMELEAAESLPALFGEVIAAARGAPGYDGAIVGRLERAAERAGAALTDYADAIRRQLAGATDAFALGRAEYDELIGLRAFDGLATDDILQIGEEQLAYNHEQRRAVAHEIDPTASEDEVVARVKSDHPADFDGALAGYREAMDAARQFVIDKDIASMPAGETLSVIATPEYLRKVMPFAAYFGPAKFDAAERKGIYIVTPSVDEDPAAMREHNHASIWNTSIHEAYPGHHLQLTAALDHPSLVRLLIDAPEFVEGWAMYCEQMMREEGFDTAPEHRLMMYTDAIWRACRIILDIRLHRGEVTPAEAVDFLVGHTGFERPNAQAEVNRYTYTPSYQLSYLLGKVLLLRLRDDERRRLGDGFSLRGFHDALLGEGSLPISFQRRLLAARG
ncbi:MAG TPA: DUF885 domain-containing protein [Candidatus Limnocylindria bacterium]|nr:DUF885 domain-containing protein [Candidatus Limnocylindria bacterium]